MKKHFGMLIMLCFVVVGGCFAAEVTKQNLRILSPAVQDALLRVENTFSIKRNPLEFTSGDIAKTCNDYFRLKQKYEVGEGVNNTRAAQDYILCDTLRILIAAKENVFADSGILLPGDALANNLLVDSYSSSLYQKTDTHQNSLVALLGAPLDVERYAVISNTADWYYELRIVGLADVDGNGKEDWVLWLTDRAIQGSYNVMSVLVALNVVANEPIRLSKF